MAKFGWKDIAKLGASALADQAKKEREAREREERERLAREKTEARLAAEAAAREERERKAREKTEARLAAEAAARERREQEARERTEARLAAEGGERKPAPEAAPEPGEAASSAAPVELEILVAPRGSAAHAAAEAKAEAAGGGEIRVERKLFRALEAAAEHLNGSGVATGAATGAATVTLRLAAGRYTGKVRTGTWRIPKIDAPGSTLRILGGYREDWSRRDPFHARSILAVADDRTAPVLQLERKSRLAELYLSGLTIDAGASNSYGSGENLLTGQSNAYELVALSYLETERLVIADNTFANAGHRVIETLVRAASPEMEIVVRNNLVLNCVMAWRAFSAKSAHQPKSYHFEHNSFILNWPRNADRTTSNPGALEIGDKYAADRFELRRNLFAFNVGGAIHFGADDQEGPPMVMEENLFWGNGAIFEVEDPGSAAVVGKFNRTRTYIPLDPWEVEDNFDWQVADNVVEDPGLRVQIKEFQGYSSVPEKKAEAAPEAEAAPQPSAAEEEVDDGLGSGREVLPLGEEEGDLSLDLGDSDLSLDLGESDLSLGDAPEDGDLSLDDDLSLDSGADDGYFQDLSLDEETYEPKGFASRLFVDAPEMPFPTREEAKGYGARPDLVEQL